MAGNSNIRPGDRVSVWLDVMETPGGPRVNVAGHDYDLSRFHIIDHEKSIREDDYVTFPGSTPGEVGQVTFLLDAGGNVQPRDIGRQACYACVVVEDGPPRIISTEFLVRQEGKPKR